MARGGGVSEDLFERGLCLPSGTQMTEEELSRVTKVIRSCSEASQIRRCRRSEGRKDIQGHWRRDRDTQGAWIYAKV